MTRLWCYIEHLACTISSQISYTLCVDEAQHTVEYLGKSVVDRTILEKVQNLEEPDWDKFKVTEKSDIQPIKHNYLWLKNTVQFQLIEQLSELRETLPGSDFYPGTWYSQGVVECLTNTILMTYHFRIRYFF